MRTVTQTPKPYCWIIVAYIRLFYTIKLYFSCMLCRNAQTLKTYMVFLSKSHPQRSQLFRGALEVRHQDRQVNIHAAEIDRQVDIHNAESGALKFAETR